MSDIIVDDRMRAWETAFTKVRSIVDGLVANARDNLVRSVGKDGSLGGGDREQPDQGHLDLWRHPQQWVGRVVGQIPRL